MYLATYKHRYWCDGMTTSHGSVTAKTMEELRHKAAHIQYEARFPNGDDEAEDRDAKTYDWKIYRLEGSLDVEELPEYKQMRYARRAKLKVAAIDRRQEKAESKRRQDEWERSMYESLRAKFEGERTANDEQGKQAP